MRRNEPFPAAHRVEALTAAYDGRLKATPREVAVETALEIVFGGIPFAVMMVTPADIEDFVTGFCFTEGVIEKPGEIRDIAVEQTIGGLRALVDLKPERLHAHLARRRAIAGRTGCGVCGIDDLDQLRRADPPSGDAPRIPVAAVARALKALEQAQPLSGRTRAVHAAAWAGPDGRLVAVREDVGRHNALDKLVGALLRDGVSPQGGFCLITSRCSFEMVEKLGRFGGRTLVAISAPTSLALERAERLDIAVACIARGDTMTIFRGADRFVDETVAA